MTTIKTTELSGAALDWAAALASGYDEGWLRRQAGNPNPGTRAVPRYSTSWVDGGALLEAGRISVQTEGTAWSAYFRDNLFNEDGSDCFCNGETALVAVARCFTLSKLGAEVEVPAEII